MGAYLKDATSPRPESASPPAPKDGFVEAGAECFRLRPSPAAVARGYVRLVSGTPETGGRVCIAPAFAATPLLIFDPARELRRHPDDATVETVGGFARLASGMRALTPAFAKATLRFGRATVRPEGGKKAIRDYRKLVKFARDSGMAFDGDTMRRRPDLALGFDGSADPRGGGPERLAPSTAVVLHLHYGELWPEIAAPLKRWRARFKLFVTLTRDDPALARRIAADFPKASVETVENKGRDVRPFLHLLERGALDSYELVCKIHGKRSLRDGVSPLFGELFRRACLLDLIGDDESVEAIQARFAREPRLGLVGPERFRARSRHGDPAEVMGQSRATIVSLAGEMGAEIGADYDVFHGTMFWARPKALARLRSLGLAGRAFAPEAGLSDGALEHAVEGLFNCAVRAAGFEVAGTSFDRGASDAAVGARIG